MRFLLLILVFISLPAAPNSIFRQESEIKLDVPLSSYDSLWEFMQKSYANGSAYLQKLGKNITTSSSVESFTDEYFDTEDFKFLKAEHGLRYRKRFYPNEPDHPKHGKQLIQVKLTNNGKGSVVRSEVKFPAVDSFYHDSYDDKHPLLSHVPDKERQPLKNFLKKLGHNAYDFKTSLLIEQKRSRIYFKQDKVSFLTLTLDQVLKNHKVLFCEIEVEINEILFTKSDQKTRTKLEALAEKIKSDLTTKYPGIKQDQTPKYNKAIALLNKQKGK